MTKEEAIKELNTFRIGAKSELGKTALDKAIKALEQEPVLDKITEEIQTLRNCSCYCSDGIIDDVEDIIDKYRESEDKE